MSDRKKKMLMTATVPSMIGQFNMNNIRILLDMGYDVHVACNFKDYSCWPKERIKEFVKELKKLKVKYHHIEYSRSPKSVGKVLKSFRQLDGLMKAENFMFVHCHTPMAGVVARLCGHGNGVKNIYTVHGFHFYDGAPLKNWLLYYPIEKWMSRCTGVLITINREDYKRASEKFHAKKTVYIPGVGIDTEKFKPRENGREKIRAELGLPMDRIMLLSVGELNKNKNHESVIRAISGFENLTYVIVGKGELDDYLQKTASENGVDLRLSGFRNDVVDFYDAADIYILPSIREGLNVSLMEAMASSLTCLAGQSRGNVDLIDEGKGGYLFHPASVGGIRKAVEKAVSMGPDMRGDMGLYNLQKIRKFDIQIVEKVMFEIYFV